MIPVEATGTNTRIPAELRAGHSGSSAGGRSTLRPAALRFVSILAIVAAVVWLVAAPSTPALIAVVSALIAVVGWGDGPDHDLDAND